MVASLKTAVIYCSITVIYHYLLTLENVGTTVNYCSIYNIGYRWQNGSHICFATFIERKLTKLIIQYITW
jgi:hypothetical protein